MSTACCPVDTNPAPWSLSPPEWFHVVFQQFLLKLVTSLWLGADLHRRMSTVYGPVDTIRLPALGLTPFCAVFPTVFPAIPPAVISTGHSAGWHLFWSPPALVAVMCQQFVALLPTTYDFDLFGLGSNHSSTPPPRCALFHFREMHDCADLPLWWSSHYDAGECHECTVG